ncbi:MAG: hypothetical protein MI749_06240 [Desulfovibrionales bacterium]|nr:hypothetical protein [Desulfovibrionales bacterium]
MRLSPKLHSIRPTQHGILFFFILVAMLVGAVNYGNNAGFVLVFLLGGMALISLSFSLSNLEGLRVRFMVPNPVFAGNPLHFPLRIHAGDRDRMAVGIRGKGADTLFVDLKKGEQKQVHLNPMGFCRGRLSLEGVEVFSVFPFGLFRIRMKLDPDVSGLVYPTQVPDTADPSQDGWDGGSGGARGVEDFQGLNPYQPGYSMGRIAWKAFSAGRGLLIKDFSGGEGGGENLVFDYERFPGGGVEDKISRLCYWVVIAHGQRLPFALHLPGHRIYPPDTPSQTRVDEHYHACLRALALFEGG